MTPMPPCWAMAIAMPSSVTVSMAEDIKGMFSSMVRVRRVRVDVWAGSTDDSAGSTRTSSNASASRMRALKSVVQEEDVMPAGPRWSCVVGRLKSEPGAKRPSRPLAGPHRLIPPWRGSLFFAVDFKEFVGWETWIRTRADRVRAGSSTAKLSPKR